MVPSFFIANHNITKFQLPIPTEMIGFHLTTSFDKFNYVR